MQEGLTCPHCGRLVYSYRNPIPTVDIIIELEDKGIILIKRAKEPFGWAIPGGFVDYGESLEQAAIREAREETGLDITLLGQFHTYSAPGRDPRQHTISTVFVARGSGSPRDASDAAQTGVFLEGRLPAPLAFDHARILQDYFEHRRQKPQPFATKQLLP